MAHYALVNKDNQVVQVIVIDMDPNSWDHTQALAEQVGGRWIQTSYNTRGGLHYGLDGNPDGGLALRLNFAGVGFSYIEELDAFVPPKPHNSWLLDKDTGFWYPPVPYPQDGQPHLWNEETLQWVLVPDRQPPVLTPVDVPVDNPTTSSDPTTV